jgi:membrane peptidoglycan carboxypeptidase
MPSSTYRAAVRRAWPLIGAAAAAGAVVAAAALPAAGGFTVLARYAAQQVRPVPLDAAALPQRSVIVARDGTVLGTFLTQDRVDVPLARASAPMQSAIVAIEDSRFWTNGPLDLKGTLRALVHDRHGAGVQGASTLVQQYVKNVLEDDAAESMTAAQREIGDPPTVRRRARPGPRTPPRGAPMTRPAHRA